MAKADFVIKLGGSAITHKDTPHSPNLPVIEAVGQEIAQSLGGKKIVLVYGGGSFGHSAAGKHLVGGRLPSPLGMAEVRGAMLSLAKILTDSFLAQGLPILCINPSSTLILRDGRISNEACLTEVVGTALESGLVPAVGGDIILEEQGGARIVSGDLLSRLLARHLGAQALLFGTDVDGIMENGRLRREIHREELDSLIDRTGGRHGDVTGGMAGKLAEVRSYLDEGGRLAVIFNLARVGRLSHIINGDAVECTYIRSDRKVNRE